MPPARGQQRAGRPAHPARCAGPGVARGGPCGARHGAAQRRPHRATLVGVGALSAHRRTRPPGQRLPACGRCDDARTSPQRRDAEVEVYFQHASTRLSSAGHGSGTASGDALARLWRQQGQRTEARKLLAPSTVGPPRALTPPSGDCACHGTVWDLQRGHQHHRGLCREHGPYAATDQLC